MWIALRIGVFATAVILLVGTFGLSARAAQDLPAIISPANATSPIELNACKAWLSDTSVGNVNYYINEEVAFTNRTQKHVVAVRFLFGVRDAFGELRRMLSGDTTGDFAPGVLIQPKVDRVVTGMPTSQAWQAINLTPNAADVICGVQLVRFDDGTVWKYDPTKDPNNPLSQPSPTASPG